MLEVWLGLGEVRISTYIPLITNNQTSVQYEKQKHDDGGI
jgi:hypothetical protein